MSDERDEWVRVESEDELRPGMAVQVRPCRWCRKTHVRILLRFDKGLWVLPHRSCGPYYTVRAGYYFAIREGRLYRLRDLPAEDTTTVATKRRVSVKAGR